MARRVLLETNYTFSPSTRTVTIPRALPQGRLLLITDVSQNKVIYNFSDPTLTATSWTITQGTNTLPAQTAITLAYNTTSLPSTDALQFVIDEPAEYITPAEDMQDAVGKFRVSTPTALVDTDFEYGLQPTKWETLSMVGNRPSFFINTQQSNTIYDIQAVNGSANVTVNVFGALAGANVPPPVGTPIQMQDTLFYGGNGPFLVIANNVTANTFTYNARFPYTGTTGSVFNSTLSKFFIGSFYSNAAYQLANSNNAISFSGNNITFQTLEPHALSIGDGIYLVNSSSTSNAANGSWTVVSTPNANVFTITVNANPTGNVNNAIIYPRPDGVYLHRAFDGGVFFTAGNQAHGLQTIRQTRRNFRYQAGKGIQMSTGTMLKPGVFVDDLSSSGTLVTVTTKFPHYFAPGVSVTISGANESAYNGTFTIASVVDPYQFTYQALSAPTNSPASGFPIYVVANSWYGSQNRVGLFNDQNGIYFEFNGQTLSVVRRRATDQIGGFVNVTQGSSVITGATVNGVSTKFSRQLTPGDYVVIRGMTYKVIDISSDTSMRVSPPYRGATLSGQNVAIVSKVIEVRVPQSQFNMDRVDGTGPSGLVVDLTKMQMFYIDYSWYGAGTIRVGFRDNNGKIFYCHRFVNTNQNYAAYMRVGNLPGRYETSTLPPTTNLASSMLNTDTTLTVANAAGFPTFGTLKIEDPSVNGYEYVYYTGLSGNTFTGLTRAQATAQTNFCNTISGNCTVNTNTSVSNLQAGMAISGNTIPAGTFIYSVNYSTVNGNNQFVLSQAPTASNTQAANLVSLAMGSSTANAHTITATAPIAVSLHAPSFAPTISHWGTSVIMDGGFDNDKAYIFTSGEPSNTAIAAGATSALVTLRVSPSVDSGVTGVLGSKEIVNRMQLQLRNMDVLTTGSFFIQLILNNSLSAGTGTIGSFGSIANNTSSLAQIADHSGNVQIVGGETIYGFYVAGGQTSTGGNNAVVFQDLSFMRDLGNSILGGGLTNVAGANTYPDGPDQLTIAATNIGPTAANVQVRLSWQEAQS